MCRMIFEVEGNVSVESVSAINKERSIVSVDGKLVTSGFTDAAIARSIGLRNIANAVGPDEMLGQFSVAEIAAHLQEYGLCDDLLAQLMGVQNEAA